MSHRSDDARDDNLLARVGALPRPALGAAADNRIHAQARVAFAAAGSVAGEGAARGCWARLWSRTLEPVAVIAALAGYLAWTVTALAEINRGHEREIATALRAAPPARATIGRSAVR